MKDLVFLISLFAPEFFFCLTALLGISYEGDSKIYAFFCISVFVASVLVFIKSTRINTLDFRVVISLLFLFVYIFTCFISGYVFEQSGLCLVSFGVPATLAAIHYGIKGSIDEFVTWLDVMLIIMTLSFPFLVMRMFASIEEGVGYYSQNTSYYASFCFLITIFLLKYGELYKRHSFATTKLYRIICFFLLPFHLFVLFVSGGRGAFVVVALGILSFITTYRGNRRKLFTSLLVGGVVTSILLLLLSSFVNVEEIDTLVRNFERIFSVFDSDLDDTQRTSGREGVYSITLDMIEDSPLIGYGLFSYKKIFEGLVNQPYPHNIVLEWLIQGGMLLFTVFLVCSCRFIFKCFRILMKDERQIIFLPILAYGFGSLLFSGSYMESSLFWFCSLYVLNYNEELSLRLDNYKL